MKKHILCFGDSNTHGYWAETDGRFDEEHRWTQLLQKKLGEGYLVIEEGLSGRTTCFRDPTHEGMSGLDYIYPCLKSHELIDLLIIMLGTNDTKERFGASAQCIAIGMGRLIKKAISVEECWRGRRPNILLVTPQNIGMRILHARLQWDAAVQKNRKGLQQSMRRLHRSLDVIILMRIRWSQMVRMMWTLCI